MESKQIIKVTNTNFNSKKPVIRQEVINFKRRKISDNDQEFDPSQLETGLIFLDTDTALEPEPLTIEISEDDEQEQMGVIQDTSIITDFVDAEMNDEDFQLQNAEIVAEELEEGQHPLDDLELEEGEIKGANVGFMRRQFRNNFLKEYLCPMCDRTFTQKGNLMRHYYTHTGAKPFECTLCGHKFTQKSNLQKHIATHNGDKKFECGVCHKGFVQKANLIRHLRIHTGEKPFQCLLCGHRFSQKGNLNKHMLLHNSDSAVVCDFCECRFSSDSAKVRHESVVHSDKSKNGNLESEIMNIRQDFNCDECPAVFRSERSLAKHLKFHE